MRNDLKNKIIYNDGRCYIEITSKKHGIHLCEIDAEDIGLIQQHKWCVNLWGNRLYVVANIKQDAKRSTLPIHRLIMRYNLDDYPGFVVDHANGDTFLNIKSNLRVVSPQENSFNQPRAKGYGWEKSRGKWRARIQIDGVYKTLGRFDTEAEARQAYLRAKAKYHIIPNR